MTVQQVGELQAIHKEFGTGSHNSIVYHNNSAHYSRDVSFDLHDLHIRQQPLAPVAVRHSFTPPFIVELVDVAKQVVKPYSEEAYLYGSPRKLRYTIGMTLVEKGLLLGKTNAVVSSEGHVDFSNSLAGVPGN